MYLTSFENKKPYSRYLSSLCIYPDVRFEGQHSDEEPFLLLRAHPITFVPWITASVIIFFSLIIIGAVVTTMLSLNEALFVIFFGYSALFSYVFFNILLWLFNVGIISNHRIIDIDYHLVLFKEITATSISDIADVSGITSGFIRSLFQFGDVHIQTAGKSANIEFKNIPQVDQVVSIINRIMLKNEAELSHE